LQVISEYDMTSKVFSITLTMLLLMLVLLLNWFLS
jgi:hypothetical protein